MKKIDKGFFGTNFIAKQFQKVCGAIPIDKGPTEGLFFLVSSFIHVCFFQNHSCLFFNFFKKQTNI